MAFKLMYTPKYENFVLERSMISLMWCQPILAQLCHTYANEHARLWLHSTQHPFIGHQLRLYMENVQDIKLLGIILTSVEWSL